jgi:aryl-alcohol dehydrogenase-like predicted oxidoreductase
MEQPMPVTARLGRTDLQISRIGLGCMSYGNPVTGLHNWTLDEEASQPFFRQAVELGVTFWDTANAPGNPEVLTSGGHHPRHEGVRADA